MKKQKRGFALQNFSEKNLGGFTLIELLVVIAIIALLASVVMVSIKGAREKAKMAGYLQFAGSVHHALGAYAVGIWNFDNDTPGPGGIYDQSGSGNNGTVSGPCTVPSDTPTGTGRSLSCGGSGYVVIPDSNTLDVSGKATFEAWMKPLSPTQAGRSYCVINKSLAYHFYSSDGGSGNGKHRIALSIQPVGGCIAATACEVGQWCHTVISFNGVKITVYVNGKKDNECSAAGAIPISTAVVHLSACPGETDPFSGYLDETRIYNESLSQTQIQQLYAEGLKTHQNLVKVK